MPEPDAPASPCLSTGGTPDATRVTGLGATGATGADRATRTVRAAAPARGTTASPARPASSHARSHAASELARDELAFGLPRSSDPEETLELRLPAGLLTGGAGARTGTAAADAVATSAFDPTAHTPDSPRGRFAADLLDSVADWGAVPTPVGMFRLAPLRAGQDLPLLTRWMNDPAVARFWNLAGPEEVIAEHVRAQLDGDGRSVPCLGMLDGVPMSYWEIYRADLDPLSRYCAVRPHDTGLHLLIGEAAHRGRGLGSALIRAVADLVLGRRPACARILAEPDIRNTPSVSAFLRAGFRLAEEIDLPDKRAALVVRDRSPLHRS